MKQKRIRIGRLDTAGGIAYEHGKILKKLMRELIDPQLETRLSGMFVNQRRGVSVFLSALRGADREPCSDAIALGNAESTSD